MFYPTSTQTEGGIMNPLALIAIVVAAVAKILHEISKQQK